MTQGNGPRTPLRLSEPAGRWLLATTAAGSGLVLLESTVVTVALPALDRDLHASLAGMQWTVNAFTLALSSLILLGGGLGDRFGRRRVYVIGLVGFAAASVFCGVAPTMGWLIGARTVQGVSAALVVPGSLALIQGLFAPEDRPRAVGWWSGLSGVAGAAGPFVGGGLVEAAGWRWIFLVNAPVVAVLVVLLVRHVPDSRDNTETTRRFDVVGALLAAVSLGAITYALVQTDGAATAAVAATIGAAAFVAFIYVELRVPAPMLPLGLFASRQFSSANLASFLVYGGLAGLFFLLPIQLQISSGYSPLASGLALVPVILLTLTLSARAGALTVRIGPRIPLVVGAALCALALAAAIRIGPEVTYVTDVLPVMVLMGIGVPLITPPITAAVLNAVPDSRAGIASAVNNGVARAAGLVIVAALPVLAGLPQDVAGDPAALNHGFRVSMLICAALFLLGGLVVWLGVPAGRLTAAPKRPARKHHRAAPLPQLEPTRPH
jgi:EmrB/QacA subfamily drug resistance transporter